MILLAALCVFGLAALASGARVTPRLCWLLCTAGSALLIAAGARGMAGAAGTLRLGDIGGLGPAALTVDPLSGLFLIIAFGAAVPATLAGTGFTPPRYRRLPAAIALTLAAMEVVITADNLFVLLFGWEAVTVAFYFLVGWDRRLPGRGAASVETVVFGKASGAALMVGGLLLAAQSHTFVLAGLRPQHGAYGVAYALLLLAFAVKVGIAPVHIWLPRGYARAPGPARAVMAGAAANVGFYGLWRTLQVLGPPPAWLVVLVLILGAFSAILGIAHSSVHPEITGLVAWSSVENAGVILTGFGVALIGSVAHQPLLVAAGLLAGTAQVCTHALGKTLLFISTDEAERLGGSVNLDQLRGLARRNRWIGAGLVVGGLTLAGMPLTAGFASEWLTLEALMQQFRVQNLAFKLATAGAAALIALTIGVAAVAFVRLIALTVFSSPATPAAARPDAPPARSAGHRTAIVLLISGCLGLAVIAPLQVRFIAAGLAPIAGTSTWGALRSPWVIQPVYGEFSALSPSWLWIAIPVLSLAVLATAVALSGRRVFRVRRVPAWSSASPGVDRGVGYTSFGYANPMRKLLANLLLTRTELRRREEYVSAHGQVDADNSRFGYTVDVVEVVERYIYGPIGRNVRKLVRQAQRLQSGRLDSYITYMLIAFLALLAVVTALA